MEQEYQHQFIPPDPFITDISLETARATVEAMQRQGHASTPEFFMRNFQRRALQIIEKRRQWNESISADEMSNHFSIIVQEARAGGTAEAQQITSALDWAFITYAAPQSPELITEPMIYAYNAMQREAGGIAGVALTDNAPALLEWSLRQVGIPHEPSTGALCVLFAPLEQQMRQFAMTKGRSSSFLQELYGPIRDHEAKADTTTLMEAWQQSQEDAGNSHE